MIALVAAAQRDPHAFATIYDHHLDPIYRYCLPPLETAKPRRTRRASFLRALLAA